MLNGEVDHFFDSELSDVLHRVSCHLVAVNYVPHRRHTQTHTQPTVNIRNVYGSMVLVCSMFDLAFLFFVCVFVCLSFCSGSIS